MSDKGEASYEQQFAQLENILKRLDDSKTPIDELAKDVKQGTQLILALNAKLTEVETEVADAFRVLEEASTKKAD